MLLKFLTFSVLSSCLILSQLAIAASTSASLRNHIDVLLEQADDLRSSNNTHSQQIVNKLKKQTNLSNKQQHYLDYLIALQYTYQNNFQPAKPIFIKLMQANASKLLKYRANYSLLHLYAVQKEWTKGLIEVDKIINSSSNIFNKKHKQAGLLTIIVFYNLLEQYQLALNFSQQELNKSSHIRNICIFNQLTLSAKLKGKPDFITNKELEQGIKICQKAKEFGFVNKIRSYQGELFLNKQQADNAIKALQPYIPGIVQSNQQSLISKSYNILAQAYWLKNDTVNTKRLALLSLKNNQKQVLNKENAVSYQLLYQTAEQEQNYQQALNYHKKYSQAKQLVLDETQAKHLAFQLAEHNSLAKTNEIKELSQQNKLLNNNRLLADKKQERSLLIIMILLSFLAALSTWAYKTWLTRQRLRLLTDFDNLTQVYSRSHFIELSQLAIKYSLKSKQPISCVLFDLDHFKKINDDYGHSTGDKVLKVVANACKDIGREQDIFGRLGGEEFALILPGCSTIIAEDVANKCRIKISKIDYKALGLNQVITASFGVSEAAISGFELTDLLADADSAMYISKQHGRNCVNTFS